MEFRTLIAAGCLLAASVVVGRAHDGHDHAPPPVVADSVAAPRGEAASDAFELVASLRNGELIVFIDDFATNAPVTSATVEVDTPAGTLALSPRADGGFGAPVAWATTPSRKDLIITVTAGDVIDILTTALDVPAEAVAAPPVSQSGWRNLQAVAHAVRDRLEPLSAAILPAGLGLIAGILLTLLFRRRGTRIAGLALMLLAGTGSPPAKAHDGHDHGPATPVVSVTGDLARRLPDGTIFVPKPTQRILAIRTAMSAEAQHRRVVELPARVIPDPNASGYVQASAGGRIEPPEGGFPRLGTRVSRGDVLAFVSPPLQAIDRSDMRQRQSELDQAIAVAERRILRFETLARSGAGTQVQLDEARLELQGLRDRRAALDQARREPEPLVAPVAGVIADSSAVTGQMIQPSAVVFQIVDPDRLWLEASSFEALPGIGNATARTANGTSLGLAYQGAGLASRNQAVSVHFAVTAGSTVIRLGQFVTVLASLHDEISGIAIPRASLVRATNGQTIIYVHRSAERFEPRQVRFVPLDGDRVLVQAGLEAGQRVVTQGAELIDQVR
ncbi:HlyD family efflux transporter periplasmic adaptor subunit [Phreatobacter aquaticus]|uniref:HlyD family efflux transporter periplasmic adaptor subunit n=1 Tax=Phreatobacter aquaticus TaxID=2570229 RepID=A0A4D7QP67_9HYPH|nr:efflux RND transporter periplasmic adaptor subunit [Phreatobacter aquaticus]QCK87366.1 HlyD family efflux transporter periplasmic adaptor subunit [Phreatobacter aquaticus]